MIHNITIENFIKQGIDIPVVDVRTPAEFTQGHVPGAYNIPLFTNEERVLVGTTYKQKGREQAILIGFDLTGPKWSDFIKQALQISPQKKVAVHCWRGGMRSGAMAWALNLYGFDVYVIQGGYKYYRRWVLNTFTQKHNIVILGGMTGSGKTNVLQQIKEYGQQIIDLENLAQHQGSSYGTMNKMIQPTQEQFENDLADKLSIVNPHKSIWIEDESLTIGKRSIPNPLWKQMRDAPLINMQVPVSERVKFLVEEYGTLAKDFLIECTQRIGKRLGPEQTKNAVVAINEGRMADFINLVLVYYDKTYRNGLSKRPPQNIFNLDCMENNALQNALLVMERAKEIENQTTVLSN